VQARPHARFAWARCHSDSRCLNFELPRCRSGFLLTTLVALVAVSAAGCISAPLEPREPTPGVPHFTVMTYNVHQERSGDASTVAAVGAADADILCLQEINEAWAQVLKPRYAARYPVMLFATTEDYGGLAILSKYPLEDRGVLHFGKDFHPAWSVIADTPGGRVQVMHVHLRAMLDGDSNAASNFLGTSSDHVAELESFMKATEPGLPTVVLGDFNESPKGDAVKWLEARGFRNALPLYRPGQFTWKGKSVAGLLDMTIDHVMFDGSFEPLSSWVDGSGGSDHLPVLASLELVGRPGGPLR
jgi:endonuclease/exonuclease/phosphatase family metal-dependent hydrolase